MTGPLIDINAQGMCPHGAKLTFTTTNTRVMANGTPLITIADMFTVAGCPFQVPAGPTTKPQPCVTGRFLVPATRVFINGQPAVLQTASGLCQSVEQIPQGPPSVVVAQTRVIGS